MFLAEQNRYDKMPYRKCGNSGLYLPAISLGMWWNFGSVNPYENSREVVLTAFNCGINHFDLANNYGPVPGSAEKTFGRILKEDLMPYRDELIISTKAGYRMWDGPYGDGGSRKYLLASLDQSLQRMGLDYVDIFYSHRFDGNTPLEETMDALATAVRQGKALYVGISSYDDEQTKRAAEILKGKGVPCLIHQPCYNMFNRWIEPKLQTVLKEEGIGSIAFCPLDQGKLTSKYLNDIPADSRMARHNGTISDEQRAKLRALDAIAAERGQTLAQMALAWVLREGKVTSALIGASRKQQVIENVAAVENLDFSAEQLQKIEAVLAS